MSAGGTGPLRRTSDAQEAAKATKRTEHFTRVLDQAPKTARGRSPRQPDDTARNLRTATAQEIFAGFAVWQQTPGPTGLRILHPTHSHGGMHDRHPGRGERPTAPAQTDLVKTDGPTRFGLDITFIEGTPATETVLMCSTGDTCGSSCPALAPPHKAGSPRQRGPELRLPSSGPDPPVTPK
ncbi:hypothetical protein GCM10023238_26750 [Streptomyces heliomycini]